MFDRRTVAVVERPNARSRRRFSIQRPPIFYSALCNAVTVATDLTFNAAVVVDVVVIPVVVDGASYHVVISRDDPE